MLPGKIRDNSTHKDCLIVLIDEGSVLWGDCVNFLSLGLTCIIEDA